MANDNAPARRDTIVVSPELTILVGRGAFHDIPAPDQALVFAYSLGAVGASATVAIAPSDGASKLLQRDDPTTRIALLVAPAVIARLGAALPCVGDPQRHHLPSELRAIALALRDCDMTGDACDIYRAAKGVELLCETIRIREAGLLVPFARESGLSQADSLRILAARQLIDERWSEKLPLEKIASFCGLNREKLTRGFREMFDCSIAEAIAERRLSQASRMLLTTDLPVALVGYDNGYLNNASFTRAFGRRFGITPSDYRASRLAA
jgi:AraC family transcriptional activator of pyochelin receptor